MGPRRAHLRLGAAFCFAIAVAAGAGVVVPAGEAGAVGEAREIARTEPGPFGPITVIGDSVLLGSILYSPTIADQLAAMGWGPIRVRAGGGYSSGNFGTSAQFSVPAWIDTWRSQGWDPADVLVNLGANDVGFCGADTVCAEEAILHVVDSIGPGHRIWWPKITHFFGDLQAAWNAALDRVAATRPDVLVWDWPAEMSSGGYRTSDNIHLDPASYRERSRRMAVELTADLARGVRVAGDAPLPAAAGQRSEFVPLTPDRILDTRSGAALAANGQIEIDVRSRVPAGATAVAVNLTSTATDAAGHLSATACNGSAGTVSNVNHDAGISRGAMGVVPLSPRGSICVLTSAAGHVVVDLQGAFVPESANVAGATRFTPLAAPARLRDTRLTGRSPVVEVAVPAHATAVSVNLTATGGAADGWLKAYPCGGAVPPVSNVNHGPGEAVAGSAFVPVSGKGTICVMTLVPVDVVVDLTGVFAPNGQLAFVPATPRRVLDTRTAVGGWAPIHGRGQVFDVRSAPATAQAVTGTLTQVAPLRASWTVAYPCGASQPPTSSVNATAGAVMANGLTVGLGAGGRVCLTGPAATHTLLDVSGWWVA